MDEVFIDVRKESEDVIKYFNTDFVSIDNLIAVIEELDFKLEKQKREYEQEIKDIKDNVKEYWC